MTAIGKTRYSRGKELSKERHEIKKNEKSRLTEQNAKRLKELEDEAYRIAGKYGLDADDGGGGNTMKYDEKTLEKASRRYMSKWDEI